MKRTISIVTVVLITVVASGCCGGLQNLLQHPLGPNTICEPVHRAHYDNGFEVGYGSECESCGLGSAGPVCSCRQYGPGATAGCLKCAFSSDVSGPAQASRMTYPSKASRMAQADHGVKQISYTTGCTDCVESDPCCNGCGEVCCGCCAPRCPDPCVTCCHPGPLAWLYTILHPEKYHGGCGEVYLGDFHSYPPDCCDPCTQNGRWTGASCCNTCSSCGTCEEPCSSCSSCGGEPALIEGPSSVEGPILISQTDRVVRPNESRTASNRRTYSVKRR